MKALKIVLVVVLVLIVALIAGALYLNHYIQSPAFKDTVLAAAKQSLGSAVTITDMKVSLLSGVMLRGLTVANPPEFTGNLLTAEAFVLRYRLAPLLHKRIEIEKLAIEKPVVTLVRNDQDEWNYDKLGGTKSPTGSSPSAGSGGGGSSGSPLDVTLSSLALDHGDVVMQSGGKSLLALRDIILSSAVNLTDGKLTGSGNARIATINVANSLSVKELASPVAIAPEAVKLTSLSGTCADGKISGTAGLTLKPAFQYAADIQIKNSDVPTLLQEAGVTKKVLDGKLQLTCALTGTSGLPTITGNGRAEITGGQLVNVPTLSLLATLLQIPELRNLKFDQCLLEFTIANNQMQTTVIKLISPEVQITGSGTVSLADYSLDHKFTLALAPGLLAHVPAQVRNVFTDRGDGFLTLDFKVTGPYNAPQTDLKDRLVKGAANQFLQEGLKKLFK